jgi:hypothetical protein
MSTIDETLKNKTEKTVFYYYQIQKRLTLSPKEVIQKTNKHSITQGYQEAIHSINKENKMINQWLEHFNAMPSLHHNLHNEDKKNLLVKLNKFLTCFRFKETNKPESLTVLMNFLQAFSKASETNIFAFNKARNLKKRLEAALTYLKQLPESITEFDALSEGANNEQNISFYSKTIEKLASYHCSQILGAVPSYQKAHLKP